MRVYKFWERFVVVASAIAFIHTTTTVLVSSSTRRAPPRARRANKDVVEHQHS